MWWVHVAKNVHAKLVSRQVLRSKGNSAVSKDFLLSHINSHSPWMSRIEGRTNIWWARADWFSSLSAGGKEKFLVGPKKKKLPPSVRRASTSREEHIKTLSRRRWASQIIDRPHSHWASALRICFAYWVCAAARRSYLKRCKATGLHFSPADRTTVPQETAMLCDESDDWPRAPSLKREKFTIRSPVQGWEFYSNLLSVEWNIIAPQKLIIFMNHESLSWITYLK